MSATADRTVGLLEFTPVDFLRRVAALIPPPRVNLVRFFGMLARNASLRPLVVPVPVQEMLGHADIATTKTPFMCP